MTQSRLISSLSRAAKRAGARLMAVAKSDPAPCWEDYLREMRN